MNKEELIAKLAGDVEITKVQARATLDALMDTVKKTLKKGDKIALVGFGTFLTGKRKARNGRNPQTGATIKIAAKKTIKFKAGKEFDIKPIGLGARDTLRLEYAFRLYGNDMDETKNPLEAGLAWITKLDCGDFNGKDAILKSKQDGLKRKLVGFITDVENLPERDSSDTPPTGGS